MLALMLWAPPKAQRSTLAASTSVFFFVVCGRARDPDAQRPAQRIASERAASALASRPGMPRLGVSVTFYSSKATGDHG
jgi:hypothetical protein